jgi:hypothetical protein
MIGKPDSQLDGAIDVVMRVRDRVGEAYVGLGCEVEAIVRDVLVGGSLCHVLVFTDGDTVPASLENEEGVPLGLWMVIPLGSVAGITVGPSIGLLPHLTMWKLRGMDGDIV